MGDNKSVMMKEMIDEIKKSYECFIKEENRLGFIIDEFSGANKNKYVKIVEKLLTDCRECLKSI